MSIPAFVSNDAILLTIPATANLVGDLQPTGVICCKGSAGNIVVKTGSGNTRTYPIALGEVAPFYVSVLYSVAEGTTATGLYLYPL